MAKIVFDELRFVVADDNTHMRRIVRTLLRAFGCREIYEAEDGASGLEAVEAYSPDILITDIMMQVDCPIIPNSCRFWTWKSKRMGQSTCI